MNGIEIALLIGLFAAFLGGAVIGALAIVSVASRREDRRYSLTKQEPDRLARGIRILTGVRVKMPRASENAGELYAGAVARLQRIAGENAASTDALNLRNADDSAATAEDLATALFLYARYSKTFARELINWASTASSSQGTVLLEEKNPVKTQTVPVTIYLSEAGIHEQVEAAVIGLLSHAGMWIQAAEDPIIGSWFRRMRAAVDRAAHSHAVHEGALIAAHIADSHLVLAQDAVITSTLMQNLGPVITSLQPTRDAVVRLGALLIVKLDWTVTVYQLTAAQQAVLDHEPRLAAAPQEIIQALSIDSSNGHRREVGSDNFESRQSDSFSPDE